MYFGFGFKNDDLRSALSDGIDCKLYHLRTIECPIFLHSHLATRVLTGSCSETITVLGDFWKNIYVETVLRLNIPRKLTTLHTGKNICRLKYINTESKRVIDCLHFMLLFKKNPTCIIKPCIDSV